MNVPPLWRKPARHNYSRLLLLTLASLLFSHSCFGQPAYVIDSLWIGVNEIPAGEGATLQIIRTGAQVNVETIVDGQAKIETSTGVIGWVDASYLTERAPLAAKLEQIELSTQKSSAAIEQAMTRLQKLDQLAQPLTGDDNSDRSWLLFSGAGISIAMVAFFAGVSWRNRRLRHKFGGLLP